MLLRLSELGALVTEALRNARHGCFLNLQAIQENLRFECVSIGGLQVPSQLTDFCHQSLHTL
jgi:hypothetical protein